MAYTMEGTIIKKFDTVQITETFKKREFVLEVLDGKYTQQIKFELTNDKVEIIAECKKGDKIAVRFEIRGRAWKSDNKET